MAEQELESREAREERYRRVRDREPLESLPNGLIIVRSMKHEAVDIANLTPEKLTIRTGKRFGSKFTGQWTLARYVDWIRQTVSGLGWTRNTGIASQVVRVPDKVGVSNGKAVRTIKLVSDGMYLHAYPVEDV